MKIRIFVLLVFILVISSNPTEVYLLPTIGMPVYEDMAQVQSRIKWQQLGTVDDDELGDTENADSDKSDSENTNSSDPQKKDRESDKGKEKETFFVTGNHFLTLNIDKTLNPEKRKEIKYFF